MLNSGLRPSFYITQCSQLDLVLGMGHWYNIIILRRRGLLDISSHVQTCSAIFINFHQFPAIFSHFQPIQAIYSHFQNSSSHIQPLTAMYCYSQLFPAIPSHMHKPITYFCDTLLTLPNKYICLKIHITIISFTMDFRKHETRRRKDIQTMHVLKIIN